MVFSCKMGKRDKTIPSFERVLVAGRDVYKRQVLTRSTFEVSIGGRVLPKITKQEFAILELLLKNPKQVFRDVYKRQGYKRLIRNHIRKGLPVLFPVFHQFHR